ncbi:MAG: hypothetical protein RLZZ352_1173 [Pseudomonadota bacterium]|jgi:SulP family sulfate permease
MSRLLHGHRWQRWLPFLSWPRPSAAVLRGDATAGIAVGLMVIPQGVAYAALAGMPLITGIYASMLPALVAVLFSASVRLSVGPTALTCLLVSASLAGLAEPGSVGWISLAVWLALLSGLMQVALGAARFGWLLNLVNAPVLMAFTQGAALLIIASQAATLLGLRSGWQWSDLSASVHLPALAFGVAAVVFLRLARRWPRAFPSVLLLVVVSGLLSAWTGFAEQGGPVIGQLPQGLPGLYLPNWPGWSTLSHLLLPALVISLVSFLETASSAKADNAQRGQRWDQDQDLIGQGLAKIASGLSGAFPTSSSFGRSALLLQGGAQTGWATVFAVLLVAMALLLLSPWLRFVPLSVLAAVVVVAVMNLLQASAFVRLWAVSRVEAAIALTTLVVTVLTAPRLYWGVLAGVLLSLSHFLYLRLHPRIIEVGLHPDGSLRDRHLWHLPPLAPATYALRMDAALDFATASAFELAVTRYLNQHPETRHVALLAQAINWIDATGVEGFGRLRALLSARGITLHLVGIKLPVENMLRTAGHLSDGPDLRLYRTEAEALQAAPQWVGGSAASHLSP